MTNYKNWVLEEDKDHILWLGLNRPDAAVNTINEAVLDELNSLLHEIALNKNALGLIVHSTKGKGFIAGADVKSFSQFENAAQAVSFLRKGQAVFSRLERLAIPSVAMIDGFCMGGGYELAFACTYRVATDEKDTRIGLPEIMLGIHQVGVEPCVCRS